MSALREFTVYRGTHRGVHFEINRSPKHKEEGFNWTFYVYFLERQCQNFAAIWLEDQVRKLTHSSYVTHDYMEGLLAQVEWHSGITFYEKNGHTEGHRSVKAGCDYQHYWDEGRVYNLAYIESDARRAIDSAYVLGMFKGDDK